MPRWVQSLNELKYKVLILGGLRDCIPHREATHLAGSRGGRTAFLVPATISCIGMNPVCGP